MLQQEPEFLNRTRETNRKASGSAWLHRPVKKKKKPIDTIWMDYLLYYCY